MLAKDLADITEIIHGKLRAQFNSEGDLIELNI